MRGWCLEVHDLAIAKYTAGREKDRDFIRALVRHSMVRREVLEQRLACSTLEPQIRDIVSQRIRADFGGATG
jgi:hypothetical protein